VFLRKSWRHAATGELPDHAHAYRTIGSGFIAAAIAFTALAGFVAAYKLARLGEALRVTARAGFISGAIYLVSAMAMELAFHNALSQSPSLLAEFTQGGQPPCLYQPVSSCLTQSTYLEALAGGLNMLWFGALLGITAGLAGAGAGIFARRRRIFAGH